MPEGTALEETEAAIAAIDEQIAPVVMTSLPPPPVWATFRYWLSIEIRVAPTILAISVPL